MLESLHVRPQICARIRSGPLGDGVDRFAEALHRHAYAASVIRRYVRASDIFSRWLSRHRLAAKDVTEIVVGRFVSQLKRWRPPSRSSGRVSDVATGVRHLAAFLDEAGVVVQPPHAEADTDADRWLRSFEVYLTDVKGVAPGTRRIYLRYARAFVEASFGTGPVIWSTLAAQGIANFVQTHAATLCPSACRAPVTAIRVFLRFLVTAGELRAGLEGAVPTVRQWKLAALPRVLSDEDVQRVLARVNETCTAGRRDRAVLLLLTRLGLRASEVAALRVDDIDWRDGHLRLRPGKTQRERRLPLPSDVGDALVAVLQCRPTTAPQQALFVRARPPYRVLTAAAVTGLAQRALRRADITVVRGGAHVFRHTVASRLVQRGVSMKAVADVLGHARLETTAIYAKLDLDTLASVALPWPGGAR